MSNPCALPSLALPPTEADLKSLPRLEKKLARRLGAVRVDLLLDSKLIVEQLHGRWRVKDAKLQPLHAESKVILAGFARWSAAHVPRAQNGTADALANEALDRVAAGGPMRVARLRRARPTE